MRILIPNFAAPDSFVDNVAHTLRAMGHEVLTSPTVLSLTRNSFVDLPRELLAKAFPSWWSPAERWAAQAAQQHRPHMMLCLTLAMRDEALEAIRAAGVERLVAWWGDTPANMRGLGLLSPEWDMIFLKDAAAVAKFRAVGLEAELLHEAMNPAWHKRCFESIGSEVVVAGNYYGYRQYLVGRLIDAGVPMALYGPAPPRWSNDRIRAAHRGLYIVREEKSRHFGEGLACLNSTALSEGDCLNCRAFEIAGACGLQLIEDKPSVSSCFEPGKEVLTYRSVDEILEHLARARREPDWAQRVRDAGHRRAHAEHTYERRLAHMLMRLAPSKLKPGTKALQRPVDRAGDRGTG